MPRPRRASRNRRQEPTEFERRWAFGEPLGEYTTDQYFTSPERLREVWEELRGEVLAAWIEKRPGTRPLRWWEYDAPELRRRLGGCGDPISEVLADAPHYDRGIPAQWLTSEDANMYDDALRNHTHKRLAVVFDPKNPPTFESEATYLDRLGLLIPEERDHAEAVLSFAPIR